MNINMQFEDFQDWVEELIEGSQPLTPNAYRAIYHLAEEAKLDPSKIDAYQLSSKYLNQLISLGYHTVQAELDYRFQQQYQQWQEQMQTYNY